MQSAVALARTHGARARSSARSYYINRYHSPRVVAAVLRRGERGISVLEDFDYSSGTNEDFLTISEIRLINESVGII